jgi:hypothetical protein
LVVMATEFYKPFEDLLRGAMSKAHLIDEERLYIVLLTDDPHAGVDWISNRVNDESGSGRQWRR